MRPIIYYRQSLMEKEELTIASKYFKCVSLISEIEPNDFVIPRYSLFPFPLDQEKEITNIGATLINSYRQHRYVADLQNYVLDLKGLTPRTWNRLDQLPDNIFFILKGETNSRKSNWQRDMFASSKKEAINIHSRLSEDGLIGQQQIYMREYIPLKTYLNGIGGIPITEEYRFFVAYGQVLTGGYYWQNYLDDLPETPDHHRVPISFLEEVIKKIDNQINFVVIDIARTTDDKWIVIELNDGCQSGTSCVDIDTLYGELLTVIGGYLYLGKNK